LCKPYTVDSFFNTVAIHFSRHKMPFEVEEDETLPPGWEVLMSRSKNMPYYHNAKCKKVYWVADGLPKGWSLQFDNNGKRYYFHINDKQGTTTYEKPVKKSKQVDPKYHNFSPDPMPVPAPSYHVDEHAEQGRGRTYSDDSISQRQLESNEKCRRSWLSDTVSDSPPLPSIPQPSYQEERLIENRASQKIVRKTSNSLLDLLSPGPPAIAYQEEEEVDNTPQNIDNAPHIVMKLSSNKRVFEEISKDEDPDAAAHFYNNLKRNTQVDRADSLLFHMRAMNNWVKCILINEYARRGDVVLDLACGKGGDMIKWVKRGISRYLGVDIAQKSLQDAVERFSSNEQCQDLQIQFVQGDLGRVSLLKDVLHCWTRTKGWHDAIPVQENGVFNIVSMQFSLHYMFGEEERTSRFFSTLRELMSPGGTFICTTVDPNKILMKYMQSIGIDQEGNTNYGQGTEHGDIRIFDKKKREVCTIRFDNEVRSHLMGFNTLNEKGSVGLRYNFTLRDTQDNAGEAVDLPEYLVPDDLLHCLLQENGFELVLKQNFHEFINQNTDKNRSLLEKMRVMNYNGTISDAEWEIAGLYQVIAFKKIY
jgi:mRNA (guanine-N7-)-methyltransferase